MSLAEESKDCSFYPREILRVVCSRGLKKAADFVNRQFYLLLAEEDEDSLFCEQTACVRCRRE